jgi:periplasmic protein TonB
MFNNLIESNSHVGEFKRRGSFVLFTTATYVVLFVITGVVSVYAYDARLEEQSLEIVTLLPPQEIAPEVAPETPANPTQRSRETHNNEAVDIRRQPTAGVDDPQMAPADISTKPNPELPVRRGVPFRIGDIDSNVEGPGGRGVPSGNGAIQASLPTEEPPPAPTPAPQIPKIIKVSDGVLRGQATYLPKPIYSTIARLAGVQGTVSVQILIDETGKVLSARVVSGSPLLGPEAQRAAMQARFSPTLLSGQPVKVSGVITYNFVKQ